MIKKIQRRVYRGEKKSWKIKKKSEEGSKEFERNERKRLFI